MAKLLRLEPPDRPDDDDRPSIIDVIDEATRTGRPLPRPLPMRGDDTFKGD